MLGISQPTLLRLIAAGELPTIRIRRRRLVDPDDLAAFLAARRSPRNDDDPAGTGSLASTSAGAGGGDAER